MTKNELSCLKKQKNNRKVGIMGGTFDPIHIGHLILAEQAYQQLDLDTILFMPSGNPPHKTERRGRATDEQRVDMVKLAIADNLHFELSLADMRKNEYSYTYHLLQQLNNENPNTVYYFIIGADSLFSFDTWMEPAKICKECILAVATRDQASISEIREKINDLEHKYNGRFVLLDTPDIEISSHNLRNAAAQQQSIRYFVPDSVEEYIRDHNLYMSGIQTL
ncbi:MAG: nicotinate-nucleotide adenylyltransferase [Eubacteriales bacterium]|nr:nicotinate-nucleotide adenylyltransferase [Eubacteriales bacterium]